MKAGALRCWSVVLLCLPVAVLADPLKIEASNNFNRAVVELDAAEAQCYESRQVLEANLFDGLNLDNDQVRAVLGYFYSSSLAKCSEKAAGRYMVAAGLLAAIDKDRAGYIQQGNELILHTHLSAMRHQVDFKRLPREVQEHLNNIDALQRPFDLLKSADALLGNAD